MAKKLKEERDSAGMWRVWYEITDDTADKPEAVMFKFKGKPSDAELQSVVTTFVTAKQDREAKEAALEALRQQVADLESQLQV